jgi:hypothetical protein
MEKLMCGDYIFRKILKKIDGNDIPCIYEGPALIKGSSFIIRAVLLQVTGEITGMRDLVQQAEVGQGQGPGADCRQALPADGGFYQGEYFQVIAFFPFVPSGQEQQVEIFRAHIRQAGMGQDPEPALRGDGLPFRRKSLDREIAGFPEAGDGQGDFVVGKAVENEDGAGSIFHNAGFGFSANGRSR